MTYRTAYRLYSSRNFPPLEAQFPILKHLGYDATEPWLPAYESDPAAFRRHLDDAGLACFGFHMPLKGLREEPQRFTEIARTLGATWMIPPLVPPEEREATSAFYRRLGEDLARGAELAAPHGLKVAWHNHGFEYRPLPDGSRPIDHIFEAGGDDVWFEVEFAWVTRAGADPKAELTRYADRVAVIQMKDTAPPGTAAKAAGPTPGTASSTGRPWCRSSPGPPPTTSSPGTTIRPTGSASPGARSGPCATSAWRNAADGLVARDPDLGRGEARQVLATDRPIEAPNWSRDGAFPRGQRRRAALRRPRRTRPRRIDTGFAKACNNDHGISPDGTMLVISDQTESEDSCIYTLPIDGGPRAGHCEPPSYWHGWSPDGETLAYCAERSDVWDVYTSASTAARRPD